MGQTTVTNSVYVVVTWVEVIKGKLSMFYFLLNTLKCEVQYEFIHTENAFLKSFI